MKIVIATGGSGGHLFPALKLAHELRKDYHTIHFLGSFSLGREQIEKEGFSFDELQVRGLKFSSLMEFLRTIGLFIKASCSATYLLKKINPDVVVGFGGYGSFSTVLAAVLLRYPTLIHEQNVIPGRANAVLSKFVKKIAISFPQSIQYFKKDKAILTGCPSHVPREGLVKQAIFEEFKLKNNRITILVFGGSQGSHRVNEGFIQAARLLKKHLNFQVIHISGKEDYPELQKRYAELAIPYALFEFLENMDHAYTIADLVISRAGAVTVSELLLFQLPAILVPYPFARAHQKENALVLCETKFARLIEEKDFSSQELNRIILEVINSRTNFKELQENLKGLQFPNSSNRLAREVLDLAKK